MTFYDIIYAFLQLVPKHLPYYLVTFEIINWLCLPKFYFVFLYKIVCYGVSVEFRIVCVGLDYWNVSHIEKIKWSLVIKKVNFNSCLVFICSK